MSVQKTKNYSKSFITQHRKSLSFLLVLPLLFSSFLVLAADLTPTSVIVLTNKEREKQNLAPLVESKALSKAAELKAKDMLAKNYFAHTSPEGLAPWHWMQEADYEYQFAGENLAINFTSAADQEKAWMKSKSHRENILSAHYTEVGVAVVSGEIKGKTSFVTVALFGTPVVLPLTKKVPASESIFAALPAVKGVQTSVSEISTQYTQGNNVLQGVYHNITAFLSQNDPIITRNFGEIALVLLYISLTAPGIVFVALSFREMNLQERYHKLA